MPQFQKQRGKKKGEKKEKETRVKIKQHIPEN